ncbi:MAG: hypothetical protein ACTH8E_00650 [Brochothrix thermosphacta]|uniref:hypothetical protein n=1 Tax=Brochothrix thermosphacta TaxID=2756 RepID=UPI003F90D5CC
MRQWKYIGLGNISILQGKEMISTVILSHNLKRKIKSGDWVYISEGNRLAVLNDETVKKINNLDSLDEETLEELIDIGILIRGNIMDSKNTRLKKEPHNKFFKVVGLITLIIGLISFIFSFILMIVSGLPFEKTIDTMFNNPIKFIFLAIIASVITTILHEIMHIVFSANSLKITTNLKKAVATVSLTHVWTWGLCSRVVAISSGMSIDSLLLFISLSCFSNLNGCIDIISAILVTRILWQFRINQNTDVNILLQFINDNPFLFHDMNQNKLRCIKGVSLIITIIIITLWLVPIINKILSV